MFAIAKGRGESAQRQKSQILLGKSGGGGGGFKFSILFIMYRISRSPPHSRSIYAHPCARFFSCLNARCGLQARITLLLYGLNNDTVFLGMKERTRRGGGGRGDAIAQTAFALRVHRV